MSPGILVLGALATDVRDFCAGQFGLQLGHDASRYILLQIDGRVAPLEKVRTSSKALEAFPARMCTC